MYEVLERSISQRRQSRIAPSLVYLPRNISELANLRYSMLPCDAVSSRPGDYAVRGAAEAFRREGPPLPSAGRVAGPSQEFFGPLPSLFPMSTPLAG
jgi:hypothetical protein